MTNREKQHRQQREQAFSSHGPSRVGSVTSRSRVGSATSRNPSRPPSGRTAQTAKFVPGELTSDPEQRLAMQERQEVQPTSFRPKSAVRRQRERAATARPVSAMSRISAISDFSYDAIVVDDSESVAGFSTVASSLPADDQSTAASHPASYRNSKYSHEAVGGVRYQKPKNARRPYSSYKRLVANQRESAGTRHLSITNIGVYQPQYERDQIEYKDNKKKWISDGDINTTLTQTRLKSSHAHAGRAMAGWDDQPSFVQLHAGPYKEGNTAPTYKFRDTETLEEGQLPFYTTVRREIQPHQPLSNQWEEQDAMQAMSVESPVEDTWAQSACGSSSAMA